MDTERLDWLLEQILVKCNERGIDICDVTGITNDELSCPGDVSLGQRMREPRSVPNGVASPVKHHAHVPVGASTMTILSTPIGLRAVLRILINAAAIHYEDQI